MVSIDQENGESATGLTEDPAIHAAVVITLFVLSVFILVGNFLTITSILCFTKKNTTVGLVISSVALTEVFNVLGPNIITIYVYFADKDLSQHPTLCKIQGWLLTCLRVATSLLICTLSLDRMLAVFTRHFYKRRWSEPLSKIILFSVWILSAFVATWPLLGFGELSSTTDGSNVYCFFSYNNRFAIFVVVFLLSQVLFNIACSCILVFRAPSTTLGADPSLSHENVGMGKRLQNPARHLHQRSLTRMCGFVAGVYSLCFLPWIIVICLSFASVRYPELLGLICLQLPLVSGLFSPLIYGLMWSPYRRAYIRALKWPGYKCCIMFGKGENQSQSPDPTAHGRSRTYSFWSAEDFCDEDPSQTENAFDVLCGPTSLVKPLDLNVHELEMFETEQGRVPEKDENSNDVEKTSSDDVMELETSDQFQSILDLIDEMTDRKGRPQATKNGGASKVKRSKSNMSLFKRAIVPLRSAVKAAPVFASHEASLDDIEIYFNNEVSEELPGQLFVPNFYLGRSKAVCGDDAPRSRYLDYLVADQVQGNTNGRGQVFVIDI